MTPMARSARCLPSSSGTRSPSHLPPRSAGRRCVAVDCRSSNSSVQGGTSISMQRRQLVGGGMLLTLGGLCMSSGAGADEGEAAAPAAPVLPEAADNGQFKELVDPILAYRFIYPTATVSGKPLKMLLTHEPEKYSSAAPLTADARQRIVCELLDLTNFVNISVAVGPASGVLKGAPPETWKPYDVALTVLVDRSTSRMTTGQRRTLNDVEEVHGEDRNGQRYVVYEHLSQGSPTALENARKETYRHAYAVSAVRLDNSGNPFIYTLNMSCRETTWPDLEPLFKKSIASFALLTPADNFVSPDSNPWQFW